MVEQQTVWSTFAQRKRPNWDGPAFIDFGGKEYVRRLAGAGVSRVNLEEDPNGEYWGWIQNDRDEPMLICPSWDLFHRKFVGGDFTSPDPWQEQAAGEGRVVQLRATQISEVRFR